MGYHESWQAQMLKLIEDWQQNVKFHVNTSSTCSLKTFNDQWLNRESHIDFLTQYSRETAKRVIDKQCRPRSDAAERGIWSGSPLFAKSLAIIL